MEKFLKNLYQRFLKIEKNSFVFDTKKNSTTLKDLNISTKTIESFYHNYYKNSFLDFLKNIKDIVYSKNIFEFIVKNFQDDWKLYRYLKFLEKEKIIKVTKNGKVIVLKKEILNVIPKPQTEEEIKKKIEKKLKIKIKEKEPIVNLFKNFQDFSVKAKWDQMPISQSSAIFVVKNILETIPLNKRFLFVGDDDFISIVLGITDPSIESLVVDADEQLLECIDILSEKFNLKVKTKKVDLMKTKKIGEEFIGFLANPIYTADGIKKFVEFGRNQLGEDGGFVFLEVGDEAIGNRFLDLQRFFTQKNLIIKSFTPNKIYYPYIMLYEEDKEIFKRLSSMVSEKIIKKSPKLGAALYVFSYLPFNVNKVKLNKPIYAYI